MFAASVTSTGWIRKSDLRYISGETEDASRSGFRPLPESEIVTIGNLPLRSRGDPLLRDGGCIDNVDLAKSPRRSLLKISDRIFRKHVKVKSLISVGCGIHRIACATASLNQVVMKRRSLCLLAAATKFTGL